MDGILRDLSVIAQVPRHGRISSTRDGLYLEKPGPLLFCKRFFCGDSRTQLIRDIKELVERVALLHELAPVEVETRIRECVQGLDRLHDTTYSKDAVMRSHLKIQGENLVRTSNGPAHSHGHSHTHSRARQLSRASRTDSTPREMVASNDPLEIP